VLLVAAVSAGAPARPLRVVTFNLFHGGPSSSLSGDTKDLDARLAMVIDALRALAPDVVAVQEASEGRRRGVVAKRLAEALDLRYVFAPATTRLSPVGFFNRVVVAVLDFAEGVAVLSRFPITGSEVFELPRCAKWWEPRILLRADLATPHGALAVFTAHTASDACQIRRIGEVVKERARRGPVILTGDLNRVESADGMEALNGAGALVDAFRAVHPEARGATVYQPVDAPDATVTRRVDYIFVGGVDTRVVCDSRVVLDRPGRRADGRVLWPSDHYGVLADLNLFGIQCGP
jgi:endonuclease/exonuclease/phosphatase family metal-dependent hydrolase